MRRFFASFCVVAPGIVSLALAAPPEASRDEAIKKDRLQIEGTWQVVAIETDGMRESDDDVRKLSVVNGSDGRWTLLSDGDVVSKGTSTIDPTQTPKTIDLTVTEGEANGSKYLGIYELQDQSRKLCITPAGRQRPTAFSTRPDSEEIFVTFERTSKEN